MVGGGAAVFLSLFHRPAATARRLGNTAEQAPVTADVSKAQVVSGQANPAGVTAAWIAAENAKPGTTGWKLTDVATAGEIAGYADSTSARSGQVVTLFVSTAAPTFRVDAYRMGFYQSTGARLVWSSDDTASLRQPRPTFTAATNMVEANWQPSLQVPTTGWPEGEYLFKLTAGTGKQQYVPLTVRNDRSTAAYAVINAVTTWQAYNLWGGYSLYAGGDAAQPSRRSRVVSFDRPYKFGDGAGDFLSLEYPAVSLMESLGLDVTYLTDVDLHEQPGLLLAHRAVFSLGHDEYYSMAMRNGLVAARDHGVNLAFLGANAIYRHIRFGPSPLGPDRHQIDYKSAQEDPLNGKDNADVTVNWRDPPNSNPESQLIGDFYQCNPVRADMVVADPTNWLFAGTGAYPGQRLPNVVGSEYDRYDPRVPGPTNVEILTHSPVTCHGSPDYADATYYSVASGAGVFATGTIDFVGSLDALCQPAGCAGQVLGRVMANLLAAFGTGPAGRAHPSNPAQSAVQTRPPNNGGRATTTSPTATDPPPIFGPVGPGGADTSAAPTTNAITEITTTTTTTIGTRNRFGPTPVRATTTVPGSPRAYRP
ncbi:MAG: hypothetical protein M3N98_09200 [Actinomycetota bacterium]|nr:hypothetical protein [Actinomycetota bacterium]